VVTGRVLRAQDAQRTPDKDQANSLETRRTVW
jgi:hypothetical protein